MRCSSPLSACVGLIFTSALAFAAEFDVVVYGGNSAGVIAAVQAKKMGRSVAIVGPDKHLGGLSSGGLGFTDTGNKGVIGGLARDFYHRVWKSYQRPEAWKWQQASEYGNKGQGTPAIDGEQRTMWIFEPHVAEEIFESYVRENEIPVFRDEWLDRKSGVVKKGKAIREIRMLSGKSFSGKMFIDATYEGDLMAAAGVDYHVGREANAVYDEKWNGIQVGVLHHGHHFGVLKEKISPYKVPGDPKSGLLPRISAAAPGEYGAGDKRVQAYCYRFCATDCPENRMPFPKPAGYDASQYELVLRVFEAGWRQTFHKFDPIPNLKTDTNNHGPFSFDNIGMNYDYPDGSYERRREILEEHRTYQQGLLYFLANDPRVPADVREKAASYGLPKDEFKDNAHWPHQIYVREARRMIGKFVMTENELTKRRPTPDSIGMGSYTIDSHNVQRYVTPEGFVQNEGDIGVGITPYEIAYGSIVPKPGQVANLLVPVCLSSSHIAYGSIRMEPVFMILGQSAATAAALAIEGKCTVQDLPYPVLKARLSADGQVLQYVSQNALAAVGAHGSESIAGLKGVVVDDESAEWIGEWSQSHAGKYFGVGYHHDRNAKDGAARALFKPNLPKAGRYEVRFAYPENPNRATNAAVKVFHANGTTERVVNQREKPALDGRFVSLGTFDFAAGAVAKVAVSNAGADGYVVVDAVQFLPVQ
jgi:hypothetical protein